MKRTESRVGVQRRGALGWCGLTMMAALTIGPVAAQWSALTGAVGGATTDAFLVLAQKPGASGTHIHAFSAMAQSWLDLNTVDSMYIAGAPSVQTGDWLALIRRSTNNYRAYSARLHAYADISFTDYPTQMVICVEDDIILMIGNGDGGLQASAYSAQTNAWKTQLIPGLNQHACSRFVAGVIDTNFAGYGFSARYGSWVPRPCGAGSALHADGNVLLVEPAAPPTEVLAFSGVLGIWSKSPLQSTVADVRWDHNVAYVRVQQDASPQPQACAYSAYTGEFVLGPANGPPVVQITDNTVLLTRSPNANVARHFFAFGARPSTWAELIIPSGNVSSFVGDDDWIVVDVPTQATLHAFSGLCSGAWSARAYAGVVAMTARANMFVVQDTAGTVHAYSPIHAAFAAAVPPIGTNLRVGLCYAVVQNGVQRYAYSTRHNAWVAGPAKNPAGAYTMGAPGSLVAMRETGPGLLAMFHERQNAWLSGTIAGAGVPNYVGMRNVLICDATGLVPAGQVLGFSAQRGDWVGAPGFAGNPVGAPLVDECVAVVVDAAGTLHAFGTPAATHSWFQYPLDSEFQVTHDPVTGTAVPVKSMLRGNPGDTAVQVVGLAPFFAGLPIPGLGTLLLDPAMIVLALPGGVVGTNGLLPAPIQLPLPGVPLCAQLWSQGLLVPAAGAATLLGPVPEPARVF